MTDLTPYVESVPEADAGHEPLTLSYFAFVLLKARARVALFVGGTVLIVVIGTLLQPREYVAGGSFMQSSKRTASALNGLAAQVGLTLPASDPTQSPSFYADLLISPTIIGRVLDTPVETDSGQQSLVGLIDAKGESPALRRANAIRVLARAIRAKANLKTGVVTFSVPARSPGLALSIARSLQVTLGEFNIEIRRSQAAAERRFTEQRLGALKSEVRAAEDSLQGFLLHNRDYRNSAQLLFEYDRLQRRLTQEQQVYSAVLQGHETARLEEARDTPLLTAIEAPTLPVRPESRGGLIRVILASILSSLVALAVAVGTVTVPSGIRTADALREEWARFRRKQ